VTFRGTLYDFQKEAVEMMLDRQNLLLAHDLGLGKTVTSIAVIETLIDEGEVECCLVICPASVKWQWHRQIRKFSDGALVKVIEGNKNERRAQYRAVKRGDVEYVIMNYEQVVNDHDTVRHLSFDAVICDEVVAIKNPGAARSRHVKRLRAPYRYGLSGQPIENRPEELFSIMEWVDPTVLGKANIFERTFIRRNSWGRVQYYRNLKLLRRTMNTAMHRRTRADVADQMPDVVRQERIIEFDPMTEKVYRMLARELVQVINATPKWANFNISDHYAGVDDGGAAGEIMPRLMALRMLCDHPALLDYSADQFDDPDTKLGSAYVASLRDAGVLQKIKATPKLDATLEVINEILEADERNKVVLFSFFKPMLAIISSHLKVQHEMFTGDMTPRERDDAVKRFTKQAANRVLLSSDAGGIGVDLPVANYLLSFDLPWSSGKFEQRNGRIIRISSKWPEVTLITMIMRDSIEERMAEMLEEKSAVASAWLDGKGVDSRGEFSLGVGTLVEFLEEHD
jgi:SNF2 family DNA or RNA helicase